MLTSEQAEQFKRDGFVVVERAFSPAQMHALRGAAGDIVEAFDPDKHKSVFRTDDRDSGRDEYFFNSAEAIHCFLEAGALDEEGQLNRDKSIAVNKIGHALHDLDPAFGHFCRQPQIAAALRAIGYSAPAIWQTMYIFKQPGIGGEVRWNQDASYLISGEPGVTGIWIAIEDATRQNGCLWMQPGQHHSPLREIYEVDWATREATLRKLDDTPWTQADAVPVEVPAGSMVLFSDRMPHYSSENRSASSRHAFTIHVAEQSSNWADENWLQRKALGDFLI